MGMFNAAQKVAHLLNHAGNHLHLFDNHDVDGVFLPVGPSHALLLVGQGLADPAALAGRLERIFAARDQLIEALKSIGIPVEPAGAETPAEPRLATEEIFTQPENLPRDFLDILNQVGKKPPVRTRTRSGKRWWKKARPTPNRTNSPTSRRSNSAWRPTRRSEKIVIQFCPLFGAWCNGSTPDFGSVDLGSSPGAPAFEFRTANAECRTKGTDSAFRILRYFLGE